MAAAAALRMVVLEALATLQPNARAVVVLRYWADMSVDQVADLLGYSPGTVKSQCSRALAKLRPLLGEASIETGRSQDPHETRNA